MSTQSDRYRLSVKGSVSRTALDLLHDRYGATARVVPDGDDTVVELSGDQAALRTLLTFLWDLGHEVLAVVGQDTAGEP
jgi:hypothetical protein